MALVDRRRRASLSRCARRGTRRGSRWKIFRRFSSASKTRDCCGARGRRGAAGPGRRGHARGRGARPRGAGAAARPRRLPAAAPHPARAEGAACRRGRGARLGGFTHVLARQRCGARDHDAHAASGDLRAVHREPLERAVVHAGSWPHLLRKGGAFLFCLLTEHCSGLKM